MVETEDQNKIHISNLRDAATFDGIIRRVADRGDYLRNSSLNLPDLTDGGSNLQGAGGRLALKSSIRLE